MATHSFVPVEGFATIKREGAGKRSMYPAMVRVLAASPGQTFDLGVFSRATANQRRAGLLGVPVEGGQVVACVRKIDGAERVQARFERIGRKAILVAGEPLVAVEPVAEAKTLVTV